MKKTTVFLIVFCIGGVVTSAGAQEAAWKAGVAKAIVVTPQTGVWFAG